MSHNVLRGKHPHAYLDDLESLYYMLTLMVSVHSGLSLFTGYRPATLLSWDYPDAEMHKEMEISMISILTQVEPWLALFFMVCFAKCMIFSMIISQMSLIPLEIMIYSYYILKKPYRF
jgi:hypothetical protein